MRILTGTQTQFVRACILATFALTITLASAAPLAPPTPAPPAPSDPAAPVPPRRPAASDRPAAGAPAGRVPENVQLVRDVVYAEIPGADGSAPPIELKMDIAFAKQSDGKPLPVVVYIHGGGWSGGSKDHGLAFMVPFAQGGYFAATIDYRLSGVAPYPAAVHDCKAAIRFLRANAAELSIDPERIGVWGHSAGGHLSALLGTSAGVAELEGDVGDADDASSAVQCVVDMSGPTDLLRVASGDQAEGFLAEWLGGPVSARKAEATAASPVTHVDASDPPFLIIHGTADRLVPLEQGEILRDALQAKGVKVEYFAVEGEGHVIANRRAYRRVSEFFDRQLGGHALEADVRLARPGAAGESDRPRERPRPAGAPPGGTP